MKISLILLAAPALLLAGCGSDPEPVATSQGDDDRTAAGDVKGGAISDEMLPLESVRSQSPSLAPEPAVEGSSDPASDAGNGDEGEDAPSEDAAPADDAAEASE